MSAARWALFVLGASLIATAVLLHATVGPKHKDEFGWWNSVVVTGLFVFGAACICVSTEGVS